MERRSYPRLSLDGVPQVLNLPDWAASGRYDVRAKGKPGATAEEQQQMWRALLADRASAHRAT